MARPRKWTYPMLQYLEKNMNGDILNDADTQRNPAWKAIFNGLMVTVLTDDYIPPIILAEEDSSQLHIVDGGSRTAALQTFRYGNRKISSTVENSIIPYKKKIITDDNEVIWEDAEFNIRNKTYDQLPPELKKKFDEYQIETVIHEHCDKNQIAMYIKRYNEHSAMNTNQKMFVYIPDYAKKIRKITERPFFLNNSDYSPNEKENGTVERVVIESVMCMFHLNDWNKHGKRNASFLNEKSSDYEFDTLDNNLRRLETIITEDIKGIFNNKDGFIWITLFNNFSKLGLDDTYFSDFIKAFNDGLKDEKIDGKSFSEADKIGSTKDKSVIVNKLHILETLMYKHLHISKKDLEEVSAWNLIKEEINPSITEEDVEQYEEVLDDLTLNVDNTSKLLDEHNHASLVAVIAYSFEYDIDPDDWFIDYFNKNKSYIRNQRDNFKYMKRDLERYVKKGDTK